MLARTSAAIISFRFNDIEEEIDWLFIEVERGVKNFIAIINLFAPSSFAKSNISLLMLFIPSIYDEYKDGKVISRATIIGVVLDPVHITRRSIIDIVGIDLRKDTIIDKILLTALLRYDIHDKRIDKTKLILNVSIVLIIVEKYELHSSDVFNNTRSSLIVNKGSGITNSLLIIKLDITQTIIIKRKTIIG